MPAHEQQPSTNGHRTDGAARERAELRDDYARLQKKLHGSNDSGETAEILRLLGAYRRRLSALDDALRALPLEPDRVPIEDFRLPADPGLIASYHRRDGTASGDGGLGSHGPVARPAREDSTRREPDAGFPPEHASSLVVRLLVEGVRHAAVRTVATTIAEQFNASTVTARSVHHDMTIDWTEFTAGRFESEPIHFELIAVDGEVDASTRSYLRSMVDAIVFTVESTSDGVRAGRRALGPLLADQRGRDPVDRAALTVFAHRTLGSKAPPADIIGAALGLDPSLRVISTAGARREFSYGFAVATSAAVKRARLRDDRGLPRTTKTRLQALLPPVGAPFELTRVRRSRQATGPAQAEPSADVAARAPTKQRQPRRPPSVVGPDPVDEIETPPADAPAGPEGSARLTTPSVASAAPENASLPAEVAEIRPLRAEPPRSGARELRPLRAAPAASTKLLTPPPPTQYDRVPLRTVPEGSHTGRASAIRRMIAAVQSPDGDGASGAW